MGAPAPLTEAIYRFPQSFAQQRLWFLDQLQPGNSSYNIPLSFCLTGCLNADALERSLNEIIRRHEVLRTTFSTADGRPVQVVASSMRVPLPTVDINDPEPEQEAKRLAREEAQQPFNLEKGPLVRARLLRLREDDHVLLLTLHHIIFDAWSRGVLLRELVALYEAFCAGRPSPLGDLKLQYGDYAVWQREHLQSKDIEKQLTYWKGQLTGAPTNLELPTDRPRPAVQSFRGARKPFTFPHTLLQHARALGREEGATLFMVLLAAFQLLLARYSGQEDIVVGTPIANRNRSEIEDLIGFFTNTLVLRTKFSFDSSFRELLAQVKEVALGAYTHQDVPFERLVEELGPERSLSQNPIFQVLFSLENVPRQAFELKDLQIRPLPMTEGTAKFDLSLFFLEAADGLRGTLEYNTDLFDESTIVRLVGHLQTLLEAIVAHPECRLHDLPLLSEPERQQLLMEFNATATAYRRDVCVHQLFEQQASRTPDSVAVVWGNEQLSYAQLNQRANQLSQYLARQGIGPGSLVGICMERSLEMLIGVLATLKAGAAYVPLDPDYPQDRLAFMLQDANAAVVLSQVRIASRLAAGVTKVVYVDSAWPEISRQSSDYPVNRATPDDLAYVIYTSGSTGRPKGVGLPHRALTNLLFWQLANSDLPAGARTLQFTSLSFDVSFQEIFATWSSGGTLVLVSESLRRDPVALLPFLRQQEIARLFLPFVALQQFAEVAQGERSLPGSLREVVTAGEQLRITPQIANLFRRIPGCSLFNHYGPTESHVVTSFKLSGSPDTWDALPPIGKPIANTQVYILGRFLKPVPIGVGGELCIGGVALAHGYLNRPELTAERFVPDPFSAQPGARLYRTGDLCRYRADGNIEYLGRTDLQVKVRGFRVELGEIESALAQHPSVQQAVVAMREDSPGEKRLVAYLMFVPGQKSTREELRSYLKQSLPNYMLPGSFVEMSAFPLTPSGKLNRRALPAPIVPPEDRAGSVPPRNDLEATLLKIWQEVLGLESIGVTDNFFELGGHSLLTVRVVSRIRQVLGVEVAISDLFARPVLADLARIVESASAAELPLITRAERGKRLPLSFAQQRLWFLAQMEGVSEAYHIPLGLQLRGKLDRAALGRALDQIVARHEALRTTFISVDGEPVQRIIAMEDSRFHLGEHDLRQHVDAEGELKELIAQEARTGFDLEQGPLIRGRLIRQAEDEHILLITMHHIVSDGWSVRVLLRELSILYGAFVRGEADPLPQLSVQYADYAVWQQKRIDGDILRQQAEYWRTTLAGVPALLELPVDHPRPEQQDYSGASVNLALDEKLTEGLRGISKRHGTTLYMTLLAAWAALLARLSGQQDLVIGSPVANRDRVEIEGLIGFFVNTLALPLDLSGSPTVGELLARVKAQAIAAQQHQEIPFEQVVEIAGPVRSLSHSPLFQVMFAWQNASQGTFVLPGLEVRPVQSAPRVMAKFDLTLSLREVGNRIVGGLEYATALFEPSTIERYIGYFRTLLEAVVADDTQVVDRLPMLPQAERRQVLYEWNDTRVEFSSEECIHELFEAQVRKQPDAIAVIFEDATLTYGELNRRAIQLAHYLRELGVKPDARVAICLERGFEMIVALLAVLKAGGAYVPLDPAYPAERLEYMLADSAPVVVLTQGRLAGVLRAGSRALPVLDVGAAAPAWKHQPETNLDVDPIGLTPQHLAYVIYTSGSTGTPKGVMVPHRAIKRLVLNNGYAKFEASDRVVFASNPAFDAATMEVWAPLLNGGRIVVIDQSTLLDPVRFGQTLKRQAVTVLWLTVGLFNQYADVLGEELSRLRYLIVGGDALDPRLIARVLRSSPPQHLINGYGPTETTTFATTHEVRTVPENARSIPIGRPITNTRVYILDGHAEPVPIGVVGELYIAGEGVVRGYLNQPELTAERFVADPFTSEAGARMYRTGDLGRWLADGTIDFVGRNDFQVKIRGFRVELGEIEARLAEHAGVREAVVLAREDVPGDKRLVAYYTCAETEEQGEPREAVEAEQLRAHLLGKLPEYMVPAAYVRLQEMPLTSNGKLDRKALPVPEADAYVACGYQAPVGEIEEMLARIWAEVLKVKQVGRHDNFFELGGHSLLAVRLMSEIRKVTGKLLPLATLFRGATVEYLAGVLLEDSQPSDSVIVEVQGGNAKPPFFAIVTPGANSLGYVALSRYLGEDQPFYRIQSPGPRRILQPYSAAEFENLAAEYIKAMKTVQPVGPYYLGGMCEGAHIAFDMARLLEANSEEVTLLAIFDTWVLENTLVPFLWSIDYYSGRFRGFYQLPRAEKGRVLREWLRKRINRRDHKPRSPWITAYWPDTDFVPPKFGGRITVFKAPKQPYYYIRDPFLGWGTRTTAGVDLQIVESSHEHFLREPYVGELALKLADCLERARQERSKRIAARVVQSKSREEMDSSFGLMSA